MAPRKKRRKARKSRTIGVKPHYRKIKGKRVRIKGYRRKR